MRRHPGQMAGAPGVVREPISGRAGLGTANHGAAAVREWTRRSWLKTAGTGGGGG